MQWRCASLASCARIRRSRKVGFAHPTHPTFHTLRTWTLTTNLAVSSAHGPFTYAGQFVFQLGDPATSFYVILKGTVEVAIHRQPDRRPSTEQRNPIAKGSKSVGSAIRRQGEIFGLPALVIGQAWRQSGVVARERSVLLMVNVSAHIAYARYLLEPAATYAAYEARAHATCGTRSVSETRHVPLRPTQLDCVRRAPLFVPVAHRDHTLGPQRVLTVSA